MVLHQKTAKDRLMEELLYKKISDEKKAGYRREGLWIKALSESNNDEYNAESLYVKLRLQSIIDEEIVEREAKAEQETVEREAKAEQETMEREAKAKAEKNKGETIFFIVGVAIILLLFLFNFQSLI